MTSLANIRYLFGRGRRSLAAGLLALWVSLGVQPCAIASVSEADCPHCPTEVEATLHAMDEHCGGDAKPHKVTYTVECCEADDSALETRSKSVDKQLDLEPVAGPPPESLHPAAGPPPQVALVDPAGRRCSSVALHKLYCVYRD